MILNEFAKAGDCLVSSNLHCLKHRKAVIGDEIVESVKFPIKWQLNLKPHHVTP